MKKIVLIAAMALGFVVTAVAANPNPLDKAANAIENKVGGKAKAIGLRFGYGLEASYQHSFGANFIQADLGLLSFDSINAVATYNWTLAQPQWTDRGEWGIYAGPGVALGFQFGKETAGFNVAAAGMIGIEYTFWIPLQLSLDIRPQIGVHFGKGDMFHAGGYYPTCSARFSF